MSGLQGLNQSNPMSGLQAVQHSVSLSGLQGVIQGELTSGVESDSLDESPVHRVVTVSHRVCDHASLIEN
jgi:hypothetical protein